MAKVDINLNLNRWFSTTNVNKARYVMANQMMADMDQFVPYKAGTLSQSVHINANGSQITYTTPYAKAQFYGVTNGAPVRNYTRSEHPRASKRWDLRAKALYSKQWADVAKRSLMGGTNGFN
jgi:hypothetical protein|nr:MAG TPA: Minor capsid protein [Caudoviricetes sp.]